MKKNFMTPPEHVNFEAKRLFDNVSETINGSIAYINLKGGGPIKQHTHEHDHLFIVTEGEAKVLLDREEIIIRENETFLTGEKIPHSIWSNQDEETVMIGISAK